MSPTQEAVASFQTIEEEIKQHVAKELNLTPAQASKLGNLAPAKDLSASQTVQIPINNGVGSYSTSVRTFGVSISGTGSIVSPPTPPNGTWTVKVFINNNMVVNQSNVAPNQSISIPCTSTNFWKETPFEVFLVWSTGGSTTAQVTVNGGIC